MRLVDVLVFLGRIGFVITLIGVTALALLTEGQQLQSEYFPLWDKAAHALAFLILTLLGALSLRGHHLWWLGLGLIGFGLGIEGLQPFVGRTADTQDLMANLLGILVGLILSAVIVWVIRRRGSSIPVPGE